MLFDLRSPGRRATVKFVYLFLALLLGGGLVFFGIGSSNLSGGLFDAIKSPFGGDKTSEERISDREKALVVKLKTDPKNAAVWTDLARVRYQSAGDSGNYDAAKETYTDKGIARLKAAGAAWDSYLALNPKKLDDRTASLMVQLYSETGLNKPAKAAAAQEIVALARPKAATYYLLATYSYQAGEMRKGDLAAKKAVELAPKTERKALKAQLEEVKKQAALKQVQESGALDNVQGQ